MPLVTREVLMNAYPELSIQMIKAKWSRNQTSTMYKQGFRYCGVCGYMVKIDEYYCRICGKRFRFRPRSASNLFGLVTESIYEPMTIRIGKLRR